MVVKPIEVRLGHRSVEKEDSLDVSWLEASKPFIGVESTSLRSALRLLNVRSHLQEVVRIILDDDNV